MTTAEGRAPTLRGRPAWGRALPLGFAADGTWVAEQAAREVLRQAAAEVRGVAPGALRVELAAEEAAAPFPVPPGGLPPGRLRIRAEFAATADRPLPGLAEAVREALFAAARDRLGLPVVEVDLRVTSLLDEVPDSPAPTAPPEGDPVTVTAVRRGHDHVRVEVVVTSTRRTSDVAREARAAEAPNHDVPVTVLVTDIR
ncbi:MULTISPECIES: hypothetical protein [Streptomyces]|uniref:Nucleopolyhedrovirus P10 family protein n=1 Tax=Streptomyces solicathayae TaxID=3081768 RepID=A0ABZ0M0F0_9ACTN|nr:hypothetical protein [Streptomyces sp. HUAS YS2]WOX25143.1 hypothetical protein R2D22_28670 [Streptomyces sp. HUAS YS2]